MLAWVVVWVWVLVAVLVSFGVVLVSGVVLCTAECELMILEVKDIFKKVAAAASPTGAETED